MSNNKPWVLGLSSSHNGSVCLLRGNEVVVAIQQERLSRLKRHLTVGRHDSLALRYCFDYAGIQPRDLSLVVHSTPDPYNGSPIHDVTLNPFLDVIQDKIPVLNIPHHFAHAVSVFATSGFDESAILIVDGSGSPTEDLFDSERAICVDLIPEGLETISLYKASDTEITPLEKHIAEPGPVFVPNPKGMGRFKSLGGMFSSASAQIFGDLSEAGKVMGLAPYGRQEFPVEAILKISNRRIRFFDHILWSFQHNDRWPAHEVQYKNLACSVQLALEHALLNLVSRLRSLNPSKNLCYAGGVALNSVANERIIRESGYENVYIMPAAEDSGPAIGAAYYGLWQLTNKNDKCKLRRDAFGRAYSSSEIDAAINRAPGIKRVDSQDVLGDVIELLAQGKIIGWFQGRSELGPRALGQRSILCDPRGPDRKEILNLRVKHREAFRPFAPAILLEETTNWFELDNTAPDSEFMLRVCRFKPEKREVVPAVVHVDGTGRLQTLTKDSNGRFYDLVKRFFEKTDVPIILNTSFNMMGEPIIETPEDALLCLLSTGLDYCVLEDRIVTKRSSIEYASAAKLIHDLSAIRKRLGNFDRLEEAERENAIDSAMVDIHNACVAAIAAFRDEVISHLGCVTSDMEPENAQSAMRDLLNALQWERLEEESVAHLTTAALVNSIFIRHPSRVKDWSGVLMEIIRVLEAELNRKLVRPFINWAVKQETLDHSYAASLHADRAADSRAQAVWQFSLSERNLTFESEKDFIHLKEIYNMVQASTGKRATSLNYTEQSKAMLFIKFADSFKSDPLKKLFEELPRHLRHAMLRRDQALKHPQNSRVEVMEALVSMVPLFNLLAMVPRQADQPL